MCVYVSLLPHSCGVELSSEGSNSCHLRKARLFERIELSVAVGRIYVNKKKSDIYAFKTPSHILVSSWLCGGFFGRRMS